MVKFIVFHQNGKIQYPMEDGTFVKTKYDKKVF